MDKKLFNINIPNINPISPLNEDAMVAFGDKMQGLHKQKNKKETNRFWLNVLIPTFSGLIGVFLGILLSNKKDNTTPLLEKQLKELKSISLGLDSLNKQLYHKIQPTDTTMKK